MRATPSRYVIPALLFLATILVALNAWAAFRSVSALFESQLLVQHTWMTINQVENIMSSAKDAETGGRGYLLTGDPSYLDPYYDARRMLPDEIRYYQSLISDNPGQRQRLIEMQAVLDERIGLLDQGIQVRRSSNKDSVELAVISGAGKSQMDHLRRIADDMEAEERRLLVIRTTEADANSRHARYNIAIATALDFLFIVLMFRYLFRERAMRVAAERDAENLAAARAETERQAAEVRALNTTLEERVALRTADLETANRELEAFSYSVSHDLRAPLRTVDGFSVALEEDYADKVDATGRDYIRRVRASVQRMGQLIDALLQLSRITRSELRREPFNISRIVESISAVLREQNAGRDITFNVEPDLKANGDPVLVRIALENLLDNAVKFSSKHPRIVIYFGWDKQKEAWFIRDNGAGFDMYYANKLFGAFNRLHGDKDFKGSGIGLATVARVIDRHHGAIWAESSVGNGATFWFTLGLQR